MAPDEMKNLGFTAEDGISGVEVGLAAKVKDGNK